MSRIVYVNGQYRRYDEATIHVEDRGFQFADAVYEVIEIAARQLVDATRHLQRLDNSLRELSIPPPMSRPALLHVISQVVKRNRIRDGLVYLQITRGAAPRDFFVPPGGLSPTLVCIARQISASAREKAAQDGISIITTPDIRWQRCDIKTVMLLPATLAKRQAREAGAQDAWFVDQDGFITEGASTNAWIVNTEGKLQTRSLSKALLPGITRRTLIDVASHLSLQIEERAFTPSDVKGATEAFSTSASATVMPVIAIDGHKVADGKPGPIAQRLRSAFHQIAEHSQL
ncbi:MAG: D-amino-acid transaminase [Alphaproteobacteria bacterium]|nr:D-amino-acid transaminase [Alphaproteobacteria bacterium]